MVSRGDHADATLAKDHKPAEALLRQRLPNGYELRANSLYTWRDEAWARQTWSFSFEKLKYFYKLEVDAADVLHRGDVHYFTEIGEALALGVSPAIYVDAYASGAAFDPKRTTKARVELLVRKAVVLEREDPVPLTPPQKGGLRRES